MSIQSRKKLKAKGSKEANHKQEENREEDKGLAEKEQLEYSVEAFDKNNDEKKRVLRTGYTTGTCATAATKAALLTKITGDLVNNVGVRLPKGKAADLQIAWTRIEKDNSVTCAVVKDAGDDPDVTHGAEICSNVRFISSQGEISIDGGTGVGRVTKPGLGLAIGKAAINPVPLSMIEQTVKEVAQEHLKEHGFRIIISVPKGEEIAKRTDNPRLGILGGISILGTTGIVFPYSTASFAASIRQSLDVSLAMGTSTVVLTTGGRSEDFAKVIFGETLPEHAFIQIGDFIGYTISQCVHKKIRKAIITGFIGKLTKMAMGKKQTHVSGSHVNMEFMAKIASECVCISLPVLEQIKKANTARHVSEIVNTNRVYGFYDLICMKVFEHLTEYSKGKIELRVIMFDFDGKVCGKYPN